MKELPKDQGNLAESFRSYLRKKNMSENTGDAYGRTIRQLLSIYPVPTESLLRKYRSLLIANYRPATINQRIYAVNDFLLFLEEEQPELSPDLSGFRLRSVKIPRAPTEPESRTPRLLVFHRPFSGDHRCQGQ